MELVRGTWANLEGRAIVFSKFSGSSISFSGFEGFSLMPGDIFSMYVSRDSSEVRKKTKLSPGVISRFRLTDFVREGGIRDNPKRGTIPFYASPLRVDSDEEFYSIHADVLFTGVFEDWQACDSYNKAGVQQYTSRFGEQLKQHILPIVTYRDISEDDWKQHIMENYIGPMRIAVFHQDVNSFEIAKLQFELFGAGTLEREIKRICVQIEEDGRNQNIPLTEAYVDRMLAVLREDYELAAVKTKDIERLTQQPKYTK